MGFHGHLCHGAFHECKAQSYVACVIDFIIVLRGFRDSIERIHCTGRETKQEQRKRIEYLPAEKYPYLLLRFYDTYYLNYVPENLLALSSGSLAPFENSIGHMTISFENDNDVIVYALEMVISFGRNNQYIFVAQGVWWLAWILGLEQELVIHIDNFRSQKTRTIQDHSEWVWDTQDTSNDDYLPNQVHAEQVPQILNGQEISATPQDLTEDTRTS